MNRFPVTKATEVALACAVAAVVLASPVRAFQSTPNQPANPGTLTPAVPMVDSTYVAQVGKATGSNPDTPFYNAALAGGVREILLSRQASSQSTNVEIQNLARTLVNDHTAMDQELIASGDVPEPHPTPADNAVLANMKKMSGELFDRTYLEVVEQDHERAVDLYRNASTGAQREAARNLATEQLPKLQQHLVTVQQLQKEMPGS